MKVRVKVILVGRVRAAVWPRRALVRVTAVVRVRASAVVRVRAAAAPSAAPMAGT